MYLNNLKRLRNESKLTQKTIAEKLKTNRNTYKNWENGLVMIPLEYADKLSLFYNVRLSYILGVAKTCVNNIKIKKNELYKNVKDFK